MNLNKISCQTYVLLNSLYKFIHYEYPLLKLSVKFASQICHENINKPLDGTYLAYFGIDIRSNYREETHVTVYLDIKYREMILR